MKAPEYPHNEVQRQREVEKYGLLDTLPEESYDTITSLMAYICDVPISLVAILDKKRNFLKSHHGVPFNEDPRDRSFCGHAILDENDIMIIPNALLDDRFSDNPLVVDMGVRFYAGAPLVNPNGHKLGTLCVFDTKPRELDERQVKALVDMSKQVMLVMEQRFNNIQLTKVKNQLRVRNENLKKFASAISHDLKSPLLNIAHLADILSKSLNEKVDKEPLRFINLIASSSESLSDYINGILNYYQSEELLDMEGQQTDIGELFKLLERLFLTEQDLELNLNSNLNVIETNIGIVNQVLINLVTNASKYNSKENRCIDVLVSEGDDSSYKFEVKDNGDGMTSNEVDNVFELFETNGKVDRHGKTGTGIGLATVKKLIENLGGKIWFESEPDIGSTVHFTIPKNS